MVKFAINRYTTKFYAFCPVNNARIEYVWSLEYDDNRTIEVEWLVECVTQLTRGLHEDFADQLYREWGGTQILKAHHHGCEIETIRGE